MGLAKKKSDGPIHRAVKKLDTVAHDRTYSHDGVPTKGKCALMFEEEYCQV